MVLVGIISDYTYREASSSPYNPDQFSQLHHPRIMRNNKLILIQKFVPTRSTPLLEPGELQRSLEKIRIVFLVSLDMPGKSETYKLKNLAICWLLVTFFTIKICPT